MTNNCHWAFSRILTFSISSQKTHQTLSKMIDPYFIHFAGKECCNIFPAVVNTSNFKGSRFPIATIRSVFWKKMSKTNIKIKIDWKLVFKLLLKVMQCTSIGFSFAAFLYSSSLCFYVSMKINWIKALERIKNCFIMTSMYLKRVSLLSD